MNNTLMESVPNVEVLTQVWREKLPEHYVDKPRLYSLLKTTNLDFSIEGDYLRINFAVSNEAQKVWFERKMLSELTSRLASYSGIDNIEIIPIVKEEEDKKIYIIDDYPQFPIPPLSRVKLNT